MTVKLINVFQVPPEQEHEFLNRWQATTAVYARTAGFVETHLHRNTGVGDQAFQFINIALWASKEAFIKAHEDYTPGEESIPGVGFHPALFDEVIATSNLLPRSAERA